MVSKNELIRNLTKKSQNFDLVKFINKHKFYLFIGASLIAIILTNLFLNDFSTIFYPLLFVMLIYFNKENYDTIKEVKKIELVIGIGIIIFSFINGFILTKEFNFPELVIFLVGLSVLFYGFINVRKVYMPPSALIVMFFLVIVLFRYDLYLIASPLSPFLASYTANLLSFFGYPIRAEGIRIIVEGKMILAVASECTGMWGVLIYSTLSTVLILGIKSSPLRKIICILGGILGVFLINMTLRIPIITLIAYYYDAEAVRFAHAHLGEFLWIPFIAIYWWVSFKYILKEDKEKSWKI